MRCPHCKKYKVRCRVSQATGRYYLYCEACKEEITLIEKSNDTWIDIPCISNCGNKTLRHDIIEPYLICRGCHNVRKITKKIREQYMHNT